MDNRVLSLSLNTEYMLKKFENLQVGGGGGLENL
jgi:hypothetical protein